MENNEKETFNYTYSAKQQEEIKNIRKKYVVQEEKEDKITQLRRLDRSVTDKAIISALIIGTIGALILGIGMSLAMSDLSKILGVYENMGMLIGIVIGVIGIVLVACAYPLYNYTLRKEREKIAPEILRLTDEIMK